MPQQEQTQYYQACDSQVVNQNQSVVGAWVSAVSETCSLVKPFVCSSNFIPVSAAVITAFLLRDDVKKDSSFTFVPFMLVCGGAALIGKTVPVVLVPISAMYLWFSKSR